MGKFKIPVSFKMFVFIIFGNNNPKYRLFFDNIELDKPLGPKV